MVRENLHMLDSSCLRKFGKPRTVEGRPVIGSVFSQFTEVDVDV